MSNIKNGWVGIAQWLEHWTHDQKVPGLSPSRSSRRIFFTWVNFLCWLLFWYLFHPHFTAVARKRFWSFHQKCRWHWQVTAKHTFTYTLPMWLWMKWHGKLVYGRMVYTELAPKRQHFYVAQAMQQPKSAITITISTPSLPWILIIRATKRIQSLIHIHNQMRDVRWEYRYIKAMNNNNNNNKEDKILTDPCLTSRWFRWDLVLSI